MLKLPKALTPAFSTERKPFYPLEIDYKNPLSAGLFFANIPQPGGRATLDLVSKRTADTISTLSRCVGEWYQQDELSVLAPTLWDIGWPYAALGGSDDASYTMYWRIRIPDSSATTAASIFQWGTAEIEIKRQTTSLQIIWGGAVRHTISGVSHGDIYDIVMTRSQASNVVTYYINGVNSGTTTGIGYTTFNNCDQIRYHNEADQRGEGFALFYVWVDRELTQSEVTKLIGAPYQIAKPIRPSLYLVPSGGAAYTLTADSGSYTLTGQAATLAATRTITADSGSYTFTGQTAGLKIGYSVTADSGSFALTGQTAGLIAARIIAADSGSYVFTGQAATLTYNGGAYTLTADSGSYSFTGQTAGLVATRNITADSGSYTFTGQAATLRRGYALTADPGSYAMTGQSVSWLRSYVAAAGSGTYAYTGNAATLTYSAAITISATPLTVRSTQKPFAIANRVKPFQVRNNGSI